MRQRLTRRDFLTAATGLAAGMAAIGAAAAKGRTPQSAAAPSGGGPRPNVLVILADQWNPRCLGCAGAPDVKTPHLDALAREGAFFQACYTTSPVCMPARTGLISGLYPHNLGLWGNSMDYLVPPRQAPLFSDMKKAGYNTAQIGKLHWYSGGAYKAGSADLAEYYKALGIDVCESMTVDGGGAFAERLKALGLAEEYKRDMDQRYLINQYAPRPSLLAPEDHCDSVVARRMVEHIQTRPAGQPWFAVASFSGPHPPLDAPGRYATMYNPGGVALPPSFSGPMTYGGAEYSAQDLRRMRANYLGKMSLIDDRIGDIVAAVKARGEWDRTLVVFAVDHGEMMGAHNCLSKGRFYEESARVPLIVRWPGRIAAGTTIAAPVQLFDVYPTVVEAAGGAVSPGRFAQSLLPLFAGARQTRPAVFSEIENKGELRYMIRTARYKWFLTDGKEHLFDVREDPCELNDLAGSPERQEEMARMREILREFLMTAQVNYSAGYIPKVQRMREKAAATGKELGK